MINAQRIKLKVYLIATFCFITWISSSQNLIRNGSFEDHLASAGLNDNWALDNFKYIMKGWVSLTSNPILCDCQYKPEKWRYKTRSCKRTKPHTGCNVLELDYSTRCLNSSHTKRGCSTYLGRTLSDTLSVGSIYRISFWLYIPTFPEIDPDYPANIGVGLYEKEFRVPGGGMISYPLLRIDTVIYNQWYQVEWYIRPTCEMNFAVFGVFRTNSWPFTFDFKFNYTPYYIDDVAIEKWTKKIDSKQIKVAYVCKPIQEGGKALPNKIRGVDCFFESNSAILTTKGQAKLDSFAIRIKKEPLATFTISGYTDNRGANYLELSQKRVEAVLEYMESKHRILPFRFVPFYKGIRQPLGSNLTEFGRKKNRRIEIRQSNSELDEVIYRNLITNIAKGEISTAYKLLFAWLNLTTDRKKIWMYFDPRIDILKKGVRWKEVKKRIKKSYQSYPHSKLAYTLDSLWAEDQKPRTLKYYIENLNAYFNDSDKGHTMWDVNFELSDDEISSLDQRNFQWLDSLVKVDGWPRLEDIGKRPAKAAFLISTHSENEEALTRYLPLIKKLCLKGEAEWLWYATMYDRLKVIQHKPQKYGTQYKVLREDKYELFPLEDKTKVNKWREEIGLETIDIE